MKTHCRCKHCGHRKKLAQQPDGYVRQPRCSNCGSRSWRKDKYRHAVELVQIRQKIGRYKVCHCDGYHHPHRTGFGECKLMLNGEYKAWPAEAV